jgi:broad specificity phosphatase PhoE
MELKNKYFLLRHGQTPYQRDEDKKGILYPYPENPPIEITEEGKKQIGESAKALKDKKIDLIFSSDFFRTQQSAGIVSKELGELEINLDKRLRDLDMGDFHGGPKENYQNYFSEMKEKFVMRSPNGENWNDVKERLIDFLNDVEKKYQGKNILIISHGDPLWFLAGITRGLETDEEFLSQKHGFLYPDVGHLIIP